MTLRSNRGEQRVIKIDVWTDGWMHGWKGTLKDGLKVTSPVRSIPDTLKLIEDAVILIQRTKFAP